MESWSSDAISFNPTVLDDGNRVIEGIATAPVYDRTNELITADAIKKALPDYMKLPVVTLLHRDYAIGHTQDARILDDGSLFVKVKLKNTPDIDRIWDAIKSGVLDSFSISGSRTKSTCGKYRGNTPCVTEGLCLSTITLCSKGIAANQKAQITALSKTLFGEDMTEEKIEQVVENPVEKTVETPVVDKTADILSAIDALQKTVSGLVDGMSRKEEKVEQSIVENPLEKTIGELSATIGNLSEQLSGINDRITALENQPVEKGGFVLGDNGEPKALGNLAVQDYIKNRYVRN